MNRSVVLLAGAVMATTIAFVAAPSAYANGANGVDVAQVQVPSLEVRARIASMEQVNVTAEKSIDPDAPAPSAGVAQLLAELEEIEAEATAESAED